MHDFTKTLDFHAAQKAVKAALQGAADGELYLEHVENATLGLENGRVKTATTSTNRGMGLRGVLGSTVVYSHTSDLSARALAEISGHVRDALSIKQAHVLPPEKTQRPSLYPATSVLDAISFQRRLETLEAIDAYTRAQSLLIQQVSIQLFLEDQTIGIMRADETPLLDHRPLTRLFLSVIAHKDGRTTMGTGGYGGRRPPEYYLAPALFEDAVNRAVDQALTALEAQPAPAGEMPVILGSGWPGVLFHEAVGHGLEGDYNRKKTSVFSGLMGERVAAPGITVVDDGTIPYARGSLNIDDEGTPTQRTTLIQDGILRGLMQDRLNARLMGVQPTGNARRESYAHPPFPRMTNTFLEAGPHTLDEMVGSVRKGIFARNFSGGQVDITSGKFVFSASEAFLIEEGKLTRPLQGATLIGDGASVLKKIQFVGQDFRHDPGTATCGKEGQWVPVGVGQPSLLVSKMTVGGAGKRG